MNHWSVLPELIESRDAATPEDVRRVAAAYFVPSNRGDRNGPRRAPRGQRPKLARLRLVQAARGRAMSAGSAGLQTGTAARTGRAPKAAFRHDATAPTARSAGLRPASRPDRAAKPAPRQSGESRGPAWDRRSSDRHRGPNGPRRHASPRCQDGGNGSERRPPAGIARGSGRNRTSLPPDGRGFRRPHPDRLRNRQHSPRPLPPHLRARLAGPGSGSRRAFRIHPTRSRRGPLRGVQRRPGLHRPGGNRPAGTHHRGAPTRPAPRSRG